MQGVQNICMYAHNHIDGNSERLCGYAQAATQSEFLCNSTLQGAYCWVEAK